MLVGVILVLACMRGDRDAMELLMQHGANPNAVDRDGDACLHIAAGIAWIGWHSMPPTARCLIF